VIAGILLAAGASTRFGANKLLHRLPDGTPLAVSALRNLRQGVDEVVAVVRPDDTALQRMLAPEGARVVLCPRAERGMGASLACGVRASSHAAGWLVALGDMPRTPPALIACLAERMRGGAALVAPVHGGRRGHPVGFGREFFEQLCQLDGDSGARGIVEAHSARLELLPSDSAGVLLDIDLPADIEAAAAVRL
jgi:molybdenum cofactor cytidylyltransferase